jgi:glycolate oxidase FAD binding subunit
MVRIPGGAGGERAMITGNRASAGKPPSEASSAAAIVADRVRAARAARTPLRIVGAGHWLDAGAPVTASSELRLAAITGIVDYEPADLTLTARAGTSLAELARITAAEGQWLPLEPFGTSGGTLGATVATGSGGPLAAAFGAPRDQVLGCELVSGSGEVVRAGGRVVKNVAGFDLTRLMIGAWGTLGVLTEITVRLRARPERDETIAVALRGEDGVSETQRWLRVTPFTPLAAELISASLARRLGVSGATTLLLRVGGNQRLVRAALEAAATLGEQVAVPASVWGTLATAEPAASTVLRLSTTPSRLAALWKGASAIVEREGGLVHATPQRGIVRCVLPPRVESPVEDETARLRRIIESLPAATRVVERAPGALWPLLAPRDANDRLAAGIRRAFDPDRLLNPGILGFPEASA